MAFLPDFIRRNVLVLSTGTLTVGAGTLVALGLLVGGGAQQDFDPRAEYDKSEFLVPMRDGARLFTIVYTPRDTSKQYPIMLYRTPYSIRPYGPDEYRSPLGPTEQFDRDGNILVFQDARGTCRSEGTFQMLLAGEVFRAKFRNSH